MTSRSVTDDRRVIPIWRRFKDAKAAGELGSLQRLRGRSSRNEIAEYNPLERDLSLAIGEWDQQKSIDTASEVVGLAILAGESEEVLPAAEFLLAHTDEITPGLISIAKEVVNSSTRQHLTGYGEVQGTARKFDSKNAENENIRQRAVVSRARAYLRRMPRNAVAWSNLALAHAETGATDKAEEAAKIAFDLAPGNRLILRNASRMYIHIGDPEIAHDLLVRSPRTRFDPWLMAAEIASAEVAHVSPKCWKMARSAIAREEWAPEDITELASALATHFYHDGNRKLAKKFLSKSLLSPTDNVIAQAEWLTQQGIVPSTSWLNGITASPEARALRESAEEDFVESLSMYAAWLDKEPYSSRPAIDGSFVASVGIGDAEASVYFALRGVSSNPDSWLLWNNLAVGHFLRNEIESGDIALRRAKTLASKEDLKGTLRATEGLRHFKQGNYELGQKFYQEAVEEFRRRGDFGAVQLAILYLVQEMKSQGMPVPDEARALIVERKHQKPEIAAMSKRVIGN